MITNQVNDIPGMAANMDGVQGVEMRMLIGPDEGAANFHMRQFDVAPGGHTPRHTHEWEHEMYVLAGAGTAWSVDGERAIAAGQCIFVPGGEEHQFRNTGDETLTFLCLVPASGTACMTPPTDDQG